MTADKRQISLWLPVAMVRWLRVRAAERGITRSQYIAELLEAEEREEDR